MKNGEVVWVYIERFGVKRGPGGECVCVWVGVANAGLVKSQRWGMKGRAVPPNPPDKAPLGPTFPLGGIHDPQHI